MSSDWSKFLQSVDNLKQIFINNGYSNACSDRILNDYVNRIHKPTEKSDITTHDLFYCNQFSYAYKTDERVIKQHVQNKALYINPKEKLNLTVYYTSKTTISLTCLNNKAPNVRSCNVLLLFMSLHIKLVTVSAKKTHISA